MFTNFAIEIFKVLNDMLPLYMKKVFIKKCIAREFKEMLHLSYSLNFTL